MTGQGSTWTVTEAGRKGGLTLLSTKGREHFVMIGRRGQQELRRKYPGKAAERGRKGGRPRKPKLSEEDAGDGGNL